MTLCLYSKPLDFTPMFEAELTLHIGDFEIVETIPVICPNQTDEQNSHQIVKNGHDTKTKASSQHYLCKTCGKSFYAHTSKIVMDLETQFKEVVQATLQGGRLKIKVLLARLNVSAS